jgi:hypothetical protein
MEKKKSLKPEDKTKERETNEEGRESKWKRIQKAELTNAMEPSTSCAATREPPSVSWNLQELSTSSYPEPDNSSSHHPNLSLHGPS